MADIEGEYGLGGNGAGVRRLSTPLGTPVPSRNTQQTITGARWREPFALLPLCGILGYIEFDRVHTSARHHIVNAGRKPGRSGG